MLDLSSARDVDVDVVDNPNDPPSLVPDEEEHMRHVNVLGLWHRRTPDLKTTACGIPFHSQFCATRAAELVDVEHMCSDCFTGHEMRRAREIDAKEKAE